MPLEKRRNSVRLIKRREKKGNQQEMQLRRWGGKQRFEIQFAAQTRNFERKKESEGSSRRLWPEGEIADTAHDRFLAELGTNEAMQVQVVGLVRSRCFCVCVFV